MVRSKGRAKTPAVVEPSGRSAFIGVAIAAVVLAIVSWWWLRSSPGFVVGSNADRNVLLVTIDTLRADALGSYGGRAETPNLDRLAARGARFTFAHSHAVVTLPSHASILSGRYPYEHGIRDNTGYRFPRNMPTAATLFQAGGYATGAFVGGFPLDRRFGLTPGFNVYDDHLSQASAGAEFGERERRADAVVASALGWIGSQTGKWFGWVHVYDPHVAYAPPKEWADRFPADPYLGEVSWTDAALGVLFDRLATLPRPTLVVVTGDHGESLGEHGELTHSVFAYESVLRIPLIVAEISTSARTRPPAGVVIDSPARHVDLLPTLLEASGIAAPDGLPGTSLLPAIAARGGPDRPSYFEAMTSTIVRGWAPLRGVLAAREKYIDLPIAELYDLAADPGEQRNLASVRTDRVPVLFNALKGFDIAPPGRPRTESPQTLERLRSLGYIGGGSAAARDRYTEEDDPKRLIELEQIMTRAAEAQRDGRMADAAAMYRDVIARRADTEDAYRKLALIYWRAGQPQEAIATLETALKHGVTQSEVRIKLGQYLAESGQPQRAIDLLQSVEDDPDALIGLGNAYQMAGRSADAIRTFTRVIEADPGNGLAHENIGVVHLQAGDTAAAEASLRRAIALDPTLSGADTALGVVLAKTNRRSEAIEAWKRAVAGDPTAFDALFNLTLNLAEAGRLDEARTYGERFVETAPPGAYARDIAAVRKLLAIR